jgi:hypothetical protein
MTYGDVTIPPETMAMIIASTLTWFTTTLQIEHTPLVSDGRGGYVPGTPTLTSVPGTIAQLGSTPTEQEIADRLAGKSLWTINVPRGTAVNADMDRILEPSTGRAFDVIQPLPATHQASLPIACVEV